MNKYESLFEQMGGIHLDLGCGKNKRVNWVGLDTEEREGVDIVHDVQEFPWPIPDNICLQVLMSHLWEHIEPKYRFRVMDEIWRIMKPNGQLLITAPYAGSWGDAAHPAHYSCPNESTFTFFDPRYPLYERCSYRQPKPWRITRNDYQLNGCMEVVMEAIKDECKPKD